MMSREHYYDLFVKAVGDTVEMETADGAVIQGVVASVDANYVYLHAFEDGLALIPDAPERATGKKAPTAVPLASILSLAFITVY